MDGVALELVCLCGYENFDRICVQRRPYGQLLTDFVASVGCKAMYFAPIRALDPPERCAGHGMMGIGGPEPLPDSSEA